ncbi:hypothetical protein [Magnetovibrio blakemorei]|nr:hypothetical protein [Magnetovibrio blakemorei]
MATQLKPNDTDRASSYEAAIKTALDDLHHISEEEKHAREHLVELERRAKELEAAIKNLVTLLPSRQAAKYVDMLETQVPSPNTEDNRRGEIFNNVVSLVFSKPDQVWNSAQILDEFERFGAAGNTKTILNVLNYLAKKGQLQRVSRGRYRVKNSGVLFECGADIIDERNPL